MPGLANATIEERDSFDSTWNTTAGYQLNRNIGVEFEYANLGTTDLDPIGHVDYQDINVSGLYHFGGVASPIGGKKYSLYGRLGAGTIRNQSNLQLSRDSSAHWLAGAGVQVPVNNNLSLRARRRCLRRGCQSPWCNRGIPYGPPLVAFTGAACKAPGIWKIKG